MWPQTGFRSYLPFVFAYHSACLWYDRTELSCFIWKGGKEECLDLVQESANKKARTIWRTSHLSCPWLGKFAPKVRDDPTEEGENEKENEVTKKKTKKKTRSQKKKTRKKTRSQKKKTRKKTRSQKRQDMALPQQRGRMSSSRAFWQVTVGTCPLLGVGDIIGPECPWEPPGKEDAGGRPVVNTKTCHRNCCGFFPCQSIVASTRISCWSWSWDNKRVLSWHKTTNVYCLLSCLVWSGLVWSGLV
jgi:hypothetical protein